jgi:hypothetical protein
MYIRRAPGQRKECGILMLAASGAAYFSPDRKAGNVRRDIQPRRSILKPGKRCGCTVSTMDLSEAHGRVLFGVGGLMNVEQ